MTSPWPLSSDDSFGLNQDGVGILLFFSISRASLLLSVPLLLFSSPFSLWFLLSSFIWSFSPFLSPLLISSTNWEHGGRLNLFCYLKIEVLLTSPWRETGFQSEVESMTCPLLAEERRLCGRVITVVPSATTDWLLFRTSSSERVRVCVWE